MSLVIHAISHIRWAFSEPHPTWQKARMCVIQHAKCGAQSWQSSFWNGNTFRWPRTFFIVNTHAATFKTTNPATNRVFWTSLPNVCCISVKFSVVFILKKMGTELLHIYQLYQFCTFIKHVFYKQNIFLKLSGDI